MLSNDASASRRVHRTQQLECLFFCAYAICLFPILERSEPAPVLCLGSHVQLPHAHHYRCLIAHMQPVFTTIAILPKLYVPARRASSLKLNKNKNTVKRHPKTVTNSCFSGSSVQNFKCLPADRSHARQNLDDLADGCYQ